MHVGTDVITPGDPAADPADVSAETPGRAARTRRPGAPGALSRRGRTRDQRHHGPDDRLQLDLELDAARQRRQLLDVGRRRRRPTAALRRRPGNGTSAGADSRLSALHHIQYWSNGGRTKLTNLVSLCKYHHMLVHERGYLIAAARDGTFAFYRSTAPPSRPVLPCRRSTARSRTATTLTSPPTRSSRPGTASGWTWITPSTSASPTRPTRPAARRPERSRPVPARPRRRPDTGHPWTDRAAGLDA